MYPMRSFQVLLKSHFTHCVLFLFFSPLVTEDDEDGDDGESDKQQLTEKQKRELREKEQAKAAKNSARDAARKKASEARAARAASDAQIIPNDEFEMSKTGLTIPSNGIEYVPPDHLDTFSDRPTVSDKKKCCQVCLSFFEGSHLFFSLFFLYVDDGFGRNASQDVARRKGSIGSKKISVTS